MNAIRMPSKAEGDEVAEAIFAADPVCGHCKKPIQHFSDGTALYFTMREAWKLVHREVCLLDAVMEAAPRFSLNGKAGRTMGRR